MTHWTHTRCSSIAAGARFLTLLVGLQVATVSAAETKVAVVFSGGHETEQKDGGRPVVLIAAALEVKPEVFRKAFSGVTPARNGGPSAEQARSNKAALMKVLRPLGVTNERLDEVSNYYRYRPQRGELWTVTAAKGHAVVENGKIKKIVITDAGSGYSSAPTISVAGFEKAEITATVHFDKDLKKNGSISSAKVAAP
jgi:hypothetical protein